MMFETKIRGTILGVDVCRFRESLLPRFDAMGHQRSFWIPLPFGRTLWLNAYSWGLFRHVEVEPLITRPVECARCGEEFETCTERTMHVIRKRCPEIETEEDVDVVDTLHSAEEIFR